MKKIMLFSVILLPLIVLLILLVSSAVVGVTKHVYVDSVEFVRQETLVLVKEDGEMPEAKLEVNVFPRTATNEDLVFESQDESVASVDKNGVVRGVDYGETYVIVRSAENASKSAMRKVLVTDDEVHRIEMPAPETPLYIGQSLRLSAGVIPKEAENTALVWASSSPEIIAVSADGTLTPKRAGSAVIVVSSVSSPEVKAEAEIVVKAPVAEISVDDPSAAVVAERTAQFPAVIFEPKEASETVRYSVSDKDLASVDENGTISFTGAGEVVVTASVKDGLGNSASVRKTFICTDGYFAEISLNESDLVIDYDEYAEKEIPLEIVGSPEGAYKGVTAVFSEEGVIELRGGKFYAVGTSRNAVAVTLTAETYEGGSVSAEGRITVKRKAQTIDFTENSIVTLNKVYALSDSVAVSPSDHTANLKYASSDENAATVDSAGVVTFKKADSVIITVTADYGEAANSVMITYYDNFIEGDTEIEVDDTTPEDAVSVLEFRDETQMQSGVILAKPPSGFTEQTYSVTEGADVVRLEGNRVIPLKGGFASVLIHAEKGLQRSAAVWEKTVRIYVDREVTSVALNIAEGTVSSLSEFTVTAEVRPADALTGKELVYKTDDVNTAEIGADGRLVFKKAGTVRVSAEVRFGGELRGSASASVTSTFGAAESFELLYGGKPVSEGESFTISDIGYILRFTLGEVFEPADFVPSAEKIAFKVISGDENAFVFSVDENLVLRIKGVNGTYGAPATIRIGVGGAFIDIAVNVNALADKIAVTTTVPAIGNTTLVGGTVYSAFSDSVAFSVTLGRKDGIKITDDAVLWSFGGQNGEFRSGGTIVVNGLSAGGKVLFSSKGKAETSEEIEIAHVDELSDFGLKISYIDTQGKEVTVRDVASVSASSASGETLVLKFPQSMTGAVYLRIVLPQNVIGNFDDTMSGLFIAVVPETWETAYDADAMLVTLMPKVVGAFTQTVNFTHAEMTLSMEISRSDIKSVDFVGYDLSDTTMNGDVYRGYQQVRLFAKHTYYGASYGENSGLKNYFLVPIRIDGTAELAEWSLSYVSGEGEGRVLAKQSGRKVYYGGKEYTIQTDGRLTASDGSPAPDGVTWTDPFTESGYMRVYFGGVNGLKESDILSDNFGNFDERPGWQPVDASAPGGFLRVEVGDGAVGGVSRHYNFNVAEDVDGQTLVNVVDAEGYIKYRYVVLQSNLYAPQEYEEADEALVLSAYENEVTKALIYGNGYQVNFGARNQAVLDGKLKPASAGDLTTSVGRAYNVTLKGTTPVAGADKSNYRLDFTGSRFYYCSIEACWKGIWPADPCYVKNTGFRYMNDMAVQVSGAAKKVYLENLVVVDANSGFESQLEGFYVKGFIDVFNYKSENDLKEFVASSSTREKLIQAAKDKGILETSASGMQYVNLAFYLGKKGGDVRPIYFWNGTEYVGGDAGNSLAGGAELQRVYANKLLGILDFSVWSYVGRSDIRLGCQYLADGVENAAHLSWHMDRLNRNPSLAGWSMSDHDAKLSQSV